ncbi:MAG: DUF1893 domain-containing protein [Calditrichaeota bacterium]|nr:DUF1893 domain-containing protein [Calditrichota bacterium]
MDHALEVYDGQNLIFFSDGKWLHPLFDLEIFLKQTNSTTEKLLVKDKIVGKAAALILIYLGFREVHAKAMSKIARDFLATQTVHFSYEMLIDRVACRTENLLLEENDPEAGYRLARGLREKSLQRVNNQPRS